MNARRAAARMLGIAAAVALAALAVCGAFVRYKADDFWTASIVVRLGFWKSQAWWYQRWSGRFAYTFLIGVVERIGPALVPALVTIVLIAWIAATYALVKRWPLALIFVYAAAAGAPDVTQSILWQTGLLTYVVPIAGLTAWLATTVDRDSVRWYDVVAPFVLAGFSETNTIAQIILLIPFCRRRIFRVALVASVAAMIVVAVAPGNAVRMALYPRHSLMWIATNAIAGAARFFLDELTQSGLPLVTMFLAAMLAPHPPLRGDLSRGETLGGTSPAGSGRSRNARPGEGRLVIAAFAVAVLIVAATYGASLMALAVAPPARTLLVPHLFFVAAIACAGRGCAALVERSSTLHVTAVAIAAIAPILSAVQLARSVPDAARFAHAWDKLDADLRRSAGRAVVVAGAPGSAGTLAFITHDPRAWSNRCISDYYSLDGIASAPPGRLGSTKLLEDLPVYATEGPRRHDDHDVVRLRFASD